MGLFHSSSAYLQNSSKQSTPVPSFSQNQLYTTIAEHMASIDPLIKGLSFPRAIRTQLASLQKNIEEQSFGFFLEYKYQLMKLIQSLYHEELGKSKNEVNCRELRMLCQSLISFDIEIEETLLENVLPESIKALKEIGAMNSYDSYLVSLFTFPHSTAIPHRPVATAFRGERRSNRCLLISTKGFSSDHSSDASRRVMEYRKLICRIIDPPLIPSI